MTIFGLSCTYCTGKLETLRIVNGVVHTRCTECNTISEPKPKEIKKNQNSISGLRKRINIHSNVEVKYKPIRKAYEKRWSE